MKFLVSFIKPYLKKCFKDKNDHLSIIRTALTILVVVTVYQVIAKDLINENTIGGILLAIFGGFLF